MRSHMVVDEEIERRRTVALTTRQEAHKTARGGVPAEEAEREEAEAAKF